MVCTTIYTVVVVVALSRGVSLHGCLGMRSHATLIKNDENGSSQLFLSFFFLGGGVGGVGFPIRSDPYLRGNDGWIMNSLMANTKRIKSAFC